MSDELIKRLQNTDVLDRPMEARLLMDACAIALKHYPDDIKFIAELQKALAYWMPSVFDERSAADAWLLGRKEENAEPTCWGDEQMATIERLTRERDAAVKDAGVARGYVRSLLDRDWHRGTLMLDAEDHCVLTNIGHAISATTDGGKNDTSTI